MRLRGILLTALIGLLLAGSAFADEMPFALTTTGSFSGLPQRAELTFTGTSAPVTGTTANGLATNLNLGQFSLELPDANPAITYHADFDLDVAFTVPAGIEQPTTFVANVRGAVNRNNGSVSVIFDPNSRFYTFSNPSGSGSFNLTLNNITHFAAGPNGQPAYRQLVGSITGAEYRPSDGGVTATPEPSTLVLLASSLLGVFLVRRKALAARA